MEETDIHTYQRKFDVSCRIEGDDKIILYNPDINDFVFINSSALVIWRFLENPHSVDEICAHLMEAYEGPDRDVVFQDVLTILEDLGEEYICKVQKNEP